jgi:Complex I intermediate-associated protein 30 (CIA30)
MRSFKSLLLLIVAACLAPNSFGFAPTEQSTTRTTPTELFQSTSEKDTTKEKGRQPWDVIRFVQQSSKFVSLPFVPSGPKKTKSISPGQVIWKPTSSSSDKIFQWAPLDDVVMGGVSRSTVDNASGLWKGTVTDANNGGFVGIRSTPPTLQLDLTRCQGLEITFQTSPNMPQRLKVVLRDSSDFNGIAWTASVNVPTSGNKPRPVKVKVPLNAESFVPTIFAKIVETAKDKGIDKSSITALQLVYSKFEFEGALNPKFQVGDFDLQILEVKAY